MQNNGTVSFTTILAGLAAIATFLGIPVTYVLGRRKQSAEISQTDATTQKTKAETRQIETDIALKAYDRLDDLEKIIRAQDLESIRDKRRIAELEWLLSLSEQREKISNEANKQALAELDMLRKPRES